MSLLPGRLAKDGSTPAEKTRRQEAIDFIREIYKADHFFIVALNKESNLIDYDMSTIPAGLSLMLQVYGRLKNIPQSTDDWDEGIIKIMKKMGYYQDTTPEKILEELKKEQEEIVP
jgi:hypothetical protein